MVLRYIVKKNIVIMEMKTEAALSRARELSELKARRDYEQAIVAAEDAKLRRKFSTKFKLNIHPSEEQLEMVRNTYGVTTWYAEGDRAGEYAVATQYPDGALEDKYGYTDGIPDEQLGVHDGCVTRASESFEGNDMRLMDRKASRIAKMARLRLSPCQASSQKSTQNGKRNETNIFKER
jgi:hypothetical protein